MINLPSCTSSFSFKKQSGSDGLSTLEGKVQVCGALHKANIHILLDIFTETKMLKTYILKIKYEDIHETVAN